MTTRPVTARERFVDVPGGRVWTGTYGDTGAEGAVPVLVLHGGPGMPSYYLEPLISLADERPVIFFDQLGCGRSDRPDDPSLWTVERAVAEVEAVRTVLGHDRLHLLGHSWGGFLALAYAAQHEAALASAVLSSPLVSVPLWMEHADSLVAQLSEDHVRAIRRHEEAGSFDHPDYQAATDAFYRRFLCSLDPWPSALLQTFDEMGEPAYRTLWGPSEFTQTGNLSGADLGPIVDRLSVPSLWLAGSMDESSPASLVKYAERARGSAVVFEGGTHCVHFEQPVAYLDTVRQFLRHHDG